MICSPGWRFIDGTQEKTDVTRISQQACLKDFALPPLGVSFDASVEFMEEMPGRGTRYVHVWRFSDTEGSRKTFCGCSHGSSRMLDIGAAHTGGVTGWGAGGTTRPPHSSKSTLPTIFAQMLTGQLL